MCGICGIIYDDESRRVNESLLSAMNRTMTLRGPDDEGSYIKDNAGIAMRRLSIIDLAGGHQPIANEDGTVRVILNGEIYNHEELREELEARGHVFKTRSDTEALVHAYEEYGASFLKKLNGMFGLAILDERKNRLFLARDRMGKKPLYYTKQNGVFCFGSELKAILVCPDIERRIDPTALSKYLAYEYVPAPRSIFRDIFKLEAGHFLIYEDGRATVEQYWDIPTDELKNVNPSDASRTLYDLLFRSVKRRLISDVPLGVFLSGGVDSSTVTYMMTKLMPPKDVKSFSIAFAERTFDESSYAKQVADALGCDHHEETCTPADLINLIPEIQNFLDEPISDGSIVPTYALSKFTRRHVTVALGGDGGDELFAGYPTFQAEKYAKIYRAMPGFLRAKIIEPAVRRLPVSDENLSLDFKVKQFIKGASVGDESRHLVWMGSFSPDEQRSLLASAQAENIYDDVARHAKAAANLSPGNRLLYIYKKLYLNEDILVKVDRASMGCSLEVRAPFLDKNVVEFVSRLPYKMKLRGLEMKYLLKRTVRDLLPKGIADRSKKGFGIPVAKWVKGPIKEMTMDLLNPAKISREGFFDPKEVQKILNEHLDGRADNNKKLWTLITFELWLERWGRPNGV